MDQHDYLTNECEQLRTPWTDAAAPWRTGAPREAGDTAELPASRPLPSYLGLYEDPPEKNARPNMENPWEINFQDGWGREKESTIADSGAEDAKTAGNKDCVMAGECEEPPRTPEDPEIRENEALINEMEELKRLLVEEKRNADVELEEVSSKLSSLECRNRKAIQETTQLEKALEAQMTKRQEMETGVSEQMKHNSDLSKETDALVSEVKRLRIQMEGEKQRKDLELELHVKDWSRMEADLAQANQGLKKQRPQWEEEKSSLLAKHLEETCSLTLCLEQAQQNLANKRHQWQKERAHLLKLLCNTGKSLKERERVHVSLMNRLELVRVEPRRKLTWMKRFRMIFE